MKPSKTRLLLSKDGSKLVTDEFYNTLISGLGALLAVVGTIFLIYRAHSAGKFWDVVSFSAYGFGLISVFMASTLHHGINGSPQTNHFLRQLDYYAIFLMIAGTVTPFCLILLRTPLGWSVMALVWSIAIIGIILKAVYPHIPKWVTLPLYIGMGWLGILIVQPVYAWIHWQGAVAFILGGMLFTVGGVIYGLEKPNPFPGRFGFHEIWHCFVLAGAASHFYIMVRCF